MNTDLQAEREEDALDPVITLGIEHVLLIVKGPGLSPSLPVSPRSVFREVEADRPSCHLTSLTPRHGGRKRLWSQRFLLYCGHCVCQNLHVCSTEGTATARTHCVRRVILTFSQASCGHIFSAHWFMCDKCLVSNFQKCWTCLYQSGPGVSHQGLFKKSKRWDAVIRFSSLCVQPEPALKSSFWSGTRHFSVSDLLCKAVYT